MYKQYRCHPTRTAKKNHTHTGRFDRFDSIDPPVGVRVGCRPDDQRLFFSYRVVSGRIGLIFMPIDTSSYDWVSYVKSDGL